MGERERNIGFEIADRYAVDLLRQIERHERDLADLNGAMLAKTKLLAEAKRDYLAFCKQAGITPCVS